MAVILHISDIHAGSTAFDLNVYRRDEVLAGILKEKNVDCLVCSGDLTFKGQEAGFQMPLVFLLLLQKYIL